MAALIPATMSADHATDYVRIPSGLVVPAPVAEATLARCRRPRAVDLFCGCGGMTLGLIQAGWEVVAGVDDDPAAIVTYAVNLCRWGEVAFHFVTDADRERFEEWLAAEYRRAGLTVTGDGDILEDGEIDLSPEGRGHYLTAGSGWISHQPRPVPGVTHMIVGDVRRLTGRRVLDWIGMEVGELDLVCGGPPCQGFSSAGRRNVMDPRNSLVFEFARLVTEMRPRWVVMENVPGILSMTTPEGSRVMDELCRILEEGSYGSREAFLRALEVQTGAVGLARGGGRAASKKRRKKRGGGETQPDLFAGPDGSKELSDAA